MPPQKVQILLIEDDPDDAELLLTLLGETRCDIDVVHERLLTLGLRQLQSKEFDVVFLDLSLPDSWGMDTLRRLRKAFPRVPVALMTGATMSQIAEEAEQEGAIGCLFKHDLDAEQMTGVLSRLKIS
jgi:CheY-like chemotaxis protein